MLTKGPHTHFYNLKDQVTALAEAIGSLQKLPKFKKIDGKPATYGA